MQRHVSDDEITTAMTTGITFKGAKLRKPQEEKVKTKAKKKKYITGLHGSGAAKKKRKSVNGAPTVTKNESSRTRKSSSFTPVRSAFTPPDSGVNFFFGPSVV